jgi:hypothetical protein
MAPSGAPRGMLKSPDPPAADRIRSLQHLQDAFLASIVPLDRIRRLWHGTGTPRKPAAQRRTTIWSGRARRPHGRRAAAPTQRAPERAGTPRPSSARSAAR